nr:DUF2500 domain-containing protein [Hydrogenoanaerobacterium sp.]
MFSIVPIIVGIGFIVVFAIFIISAVKGVSQWNKNNVSPLLTVDAKISGKRADTSVRHHHHDDNMAMSHTTSSTSYYVTFEVESGDRMEFSVESHEYGMLAEGDTGKLTFQGTRYKGFKRAPITY